MSNKLTHPLALVLLSVLFFALVLLNNQFLSSLRLDLTEDQVYSLSDGSKNVLQEIDEPINLYFFFSDKASKNMTVLRNYANRVESLLAEYAKSAKGKIKLQVIDPIAFSEQEDLASQFGLTAATIGNAGESIYMGLAGTNALDGQEVIGFFDPQQEQFLEYEISKLIYKLSDSEPVKVALITDLPVAGGQNSMTGGMEPAWTFYSQLQQLYKVDLLAGSTEQLPDDIDVLMLVHPKNIAESLLRDIDQYALAGGKVLLFIDPHNESDQMSMMAGMGANTSTLEPLLNVWGVEFDSDLVLLDALAGLDIRTKSGGIARHFGFVGFGTEQLDRQDVVTASLDIINGASFGIIKKQEQAKTKLQALITSSSSSDLMPSTAYAATRAPEELARQYQSKEQVHILAARLSGKVDSAYPTKADSAQTHLNSGKINVIVVADTDMLSDRFWVQTSNFFGQTIATPFANNGDFVGNAVENLGGSDALISIRSRGTFARPFTQVDLLTLKAEEKFREQEQLLQQQLADTEAQLSQLQVQASETDSLLVSPEQQAAIDEFMQQKLKIRKALREVRHQLDKDIEELGNWLKLINIALAPMLMILILMLLARLLRIKSSMLSRG